MTLAISARRNLAIALAFVVALAGLTLAPAAAPAQAASNSSAASSILKTVNKIRTDASQPKFIANSTISKFAQEYAVLLAKSGSIYKDYTPKTSLPANGVNLDIFKAVASGGTESNRISRLATLYKNGAPAEIKGDVNYGAVGFVKKGSYSYAVLVIVKYNPLLITAATPSISGSAKVGATLTAKPGTYKPAADSYTYQWKANGTNIAGATAATYVVKPTEKGKKLTVTVQGAKSGYAVPAAKTSAATKTIATGTMKISFTVEGKRNVGQVLTIDNDKLTPASAGPYINGITVKWLRDGKTIAGAGELDFDYVLTAADRGKKIDAKITLKATGFAPASYVTKTKTKVGYPLQTATPTPTISGTAAFAQVLTANPGTWDAGTKLSYQWYAGGKAISKATKSTYKLASSVVGKTITVKVTSTKSQFTTATKSSAPTAAVATIPFATQGQIQVSGNQAINSTLKVTVTTAFSPAASYTYQWYADGVAIKNATKSSYKVSSASAPKFITVKVTAKKAGYTTVVLEGGLL